MKETRDNLIYTIILYMTHIYVLLGEGLRVLSHHVSQVPLPYVELLHLLLYKLRRELLRSCSREVLSVEGRARTYLPPRDLQRRRGRRGAVIMCVRLEQLQRSC